MPRLDMYVDTSEVKNPIPPRHQVFRPVTCHALARQNKETLAIRDYEDGYVGGLARLAAIGREPDLFLTAGSINHILRKGTHSHPNRQLPSAIPSRPG